MRRSIQPSIQEVEAVAKQALNRASVEAVEHLLNVCKTGGFNGKRYDSCFYGQLARGDGYVFPSATASDDDHFMVLHQYGGSIGVELVRQKLNPIEAFSLSIHESHTLDTNPDVEHIATWCLEVLNARPLPKYVLQHDNVTAEDLKEAFV